MKILKPSERNCTPRDTVGKAFKCVDCRALYRVEHENEVRPGERPGVLVATCPGCGTPDVVASGPVMYEIDGWRVGDPSAEEPTP